MSLAVKGRNHDFSDADARQSLVVSKFGGLSFLVFTKMVVTEVRGHLWRRYWGCFSDRNLEKEGSRKNQLVCAGELCIFNWSQSFATLRLANSGGCTVTYLLTLIHPCLGSALRHTGLFALL